MRLILFSPCLLPALLVLLWLNWMGPAPRPPDPVDLERVALVEGRISSSVEPADGYLYAELTPTRVEQSGEPLDYPGKLALYIRSERDASPPRVHFGDRLRIIAYLEEPNYYAIPGVPDFRQLHWRRGILHVVRLKSERQLERLKQPRKDLQEWLFQYRVAFERRLADLPEGPARLIRSAFLGDRRVLHDADRALIRRLGVLHLFVVSGFHVALVVMLVAGVLRGLGPAKAAPALAAGWGYVLLTGAPVATVRAGVMATLYFGLRGLRLAPGLLNSLGLTALLLAALQPLAVNSPGFHFCFLSLSVIGVMLKPLGRWVHACKRGSLQAYSDHVTTATEPLVRLLRRVRFGWEECTEFWPRAVSRVAARGLAPPVCYGLSLAAGSLLIQLGALPLSLYYSNLLVLAQPLNNVLLAPAFSILVGLALGWFATFWVPGCGEVMGRLNGVWGEFVWAWMQQLDSWADGVYLPHPGYGLGALYLATYFGLWWLAKGPARLLLLLPAVGLIGLLSLCPGRPTGDLTITMLDVGQGESIHLAYPGGRQALVDCGGLRLAGPDNDFVGRALVGRYLWNRRARRLDYILLSHPHDDHIQGLNFLASVFRPQHVYHFQPDDRYHAVTGLKRLSRGRRFIYGGVDHEIVHPPMDSGRWSTNDASLVLRLRYGRFSMLLTGDVERKAETALRLADTLQRATVLKVAHHGAATSSTEAFLEAVAPELAVISAGRRNPFGHPSPATLDRLRRLGIPVLSTATHGSIRIVTDGRDWEVTTFEPNRREWIRPGGL